MQLQAWWSRYDRYWVSLPGKDVTSLLKQERVFYGFSPESRNVWNALRHFILAVQLFRRERPDFAMSCGAGIAPPFLLVAKFMHIKTIYIEPYDFIHHPTWSGRLVSPWVDVMLVQHQKQLKFYNRAQYWGATL
jgi:UDP-N-acetylglucosamine:LPS N-acetylglucosamine transferase